MAEQERKPIIQLSGITKSFFIGTPNELQVLKGIDLKVYEICWRDTFGYELFISLHNGLMEVWAAEITVVYEKILSSETLPCTFRTSDETSDMGD